MNACNTGCWIALVLAAWLGTGCATGVPVVVTFPPGAISHGAGLLPEPERIVAVGTDSVIALTTDGDLLRIDAVGSAKPRLRWSSHVEEPPGVDVPCSAAVSVSPDGRWVVGSYGGELRTTIVADCDNGTVAMRLAGATDVIVWRDDDTFIMLSDNGAATEYSVAQRAAVRRWRPVPKARGRVWCGAFRDRVLVIGTSEGEVWWVIGDDADFLGKAKGGVSALVISPDRHRIAVGYDGNRLQIWGTTTMGRPCPVNEINRDILPAAIVFSPLGDLLLVGENTSGKCKVDVVTAFHTEDAEMEFQVPLLSRTDRDPWTVMAWRPTPRLGLVVASADGIWEGQIHLRNQVKEPEIHRTPFDD